ncbi:MAG: SUMF1/EgtB/PvdO family nonheme iron enzyme [Desulfobacterales bacterium]|nr:SUMF1/EgtB/PvdO family nonheme iron enzyme [Desulfobacterales bacterium]
MSDPTRLRRLSLAAALVIGLVLAHPAPPSAHASPWKRKIGSTGVSIQDAADPQPLAGDVTLPLPGGGRLVLRAVCVPTDGFLKDMQIFLGCKDCGRDAQGFMEGKHLGALSGPFTYKDLPVDWRASLLEAPAAARGRCPNPADDTRNIFFYFIGKYEITRFQWRSVMEAEGADPPLSLTADDPRPVTGVSWFEAVDFTRRCTEWLLKNAPTSLPGFAGGRPGHLRLPTEAEWEYAARGGQMVTEFHMDQEPFFPLEDRRYSDYAVFTAPGAAKPPEKLAWIGSRAPNPLGVFDTAGNAAEMLFSPFHLTVNFRLHGATGGFVAKGGSFRKRKSEILPGRREELPFFLDDGAYRRSDVGFRVVLSAIVTPREHFEALTREWAVLENQVGEEAWPLDEDASPGDGPPGDASPVKTSGRDSSAPVDEDLLLQEMDAALQRPTTPPTVGFKDPLSEIDRLAAQADDEATRAGLHFIRKVIEQNDMLAASQQAEAIKAIVRTALFISELARSYAARRTNMQQELDRLKIISQDQDKEFASALGATEEHIRAVRKNVDRFDRDIQGLILRYLEQIRSIRKYPRAVLTTQLDRIAEELATEEAVNTRLNDRLKLFTKHVSLQAGQPGALGPEAIRADLLP